MTSKEMDFGIMGRRGHDAYVFKAALAWKAGQIEDMKKFVKKAVELNPVLSGRVRKMLSMAYKRVVDDRREGWKIVYHTELNSSEADARVVSEYRKHLQANVDELCTEMLELLDGRLLPVLPTVGEVQCTCEGRVILKNGAELSNKRELICDRAYYLKMRADYLRYKVELLRLDDPNRDAMLKNIDEAYGTAHLEAVELGIGHPMVLGIALNWSVFYYEIHHDVSIAIFMAETAYDVAMPLLHTLTYDDYCKSDMILKLIQKNIVSWTGDTSGKTPVPKGIQ